jgi:predicted nucleic acid-binding Zn ribbon protein
MTSSRLCLICKTPLIGRSDKKFCTDQCRAVANNRQNSGPEKMFLATQRILRKNRNILKNLCPNQKDMVRKDQLISAGFNFDCFTSILITSTRQSYYFSYDYAFIPLIDSDVEKALIVKGTPVKHFNPWKFVNKPAF